MKFEEWLLRHKMSKLEFCRRAGVDVRNLNTWLSGSSEPLISNFIPFVEQVLKMDPEANSLLFFPFSTKSINAESLLK